MASGDDQKCRSRNAMVIWKLSKAERKQRTVGPTKSFTFSELTPIIFQTSVIEKSPKFNYLYKYFNSQEADLIGLKSEGYFNTTDCTAQSKGVC